MQILAQIIHLSNLVNNIEKLKHVKGDYMFTLVLEIIIFTIRLLSDEIIHNL